MEKNKAGKGHRKYQIRETLGERHEGSGAGHHADVKSQPFHAERTASTETLKWESAYCIGGTVGRPV